MTAALHSLAGRRALIIGASGQVGRALAAAFAPVCAVTAASHQHVEPGHERVDLADEASLAGVWQRSRPDLVLLAGGMCHVDGCETDPERCRRVNVAGTRAVAERARAEGADVVFFSTDHVFDGSRPVHRETDPVAPLNVYADSKARAEDLLREYLPDQHLIIRTSWVYGLDVYRRNFVLRLVDQVRQGHDVVVPEDQWGSPTYADDLARALKQLLEDGRRGTYHAAGSDFVSRLSLAERVCAYFGLDATKIVPRSTASLRQAARRPLEVRLDGQKLRDAGVEPLPGIDAGLERLRQAVEVPAASR